MREIYECRAATGNCTHSPEWFAEWLDVPVSKVKSALFVLCKSKELFIKKEGGEVVEMRPLKSQHAPKIIYSQKQLKAAYASHKAWKSNRK